MSVPKDKYNLVYILFIIHGLSILGPWNIMLNAFDYFKMKLEVNDNSSERLKNYNTNFMSYLGIASKTPNLMIQIINIFLPKSCGNLSTRILFSLVVQTLVMVYTIFLAIVDNKDNQEAFFWSTIVSNAILGMGGGLCQSSAFGSASNMPSKYINALSVGINLSGVIVSVFNIISLAIAPDPVWMAVIYFSSAIVLLIVCFVLEITLRSNEFRLYHKNLAENQSKSNEDTTTENAPNKRNPYIFVLTKIYPQLLDIFLILFVTFAIFPAIMASIKSSDNWISDKYFGSVFCFLIFQSFTFVGTITAEYIRYPTTDSMRVISWGRLLLIPIYLFFDYKPEHIKRKLPVLFRSDLLYVVFNIILGISYGHLSSLSLMYAPKQVEPKYARIAGMMSVLMFLIGILFAFSFSLIFPYIV